MSKVLRGYAGFSLVEVLIYFFLLMTVLTGLFHFVVRVHQNIADFGRRSGMLIQLCAAQDALTRELSNAPCDMQHWEQFGPTTLSWKSKKKKIIWTVEGKNLVRAEHSFDEAKKMWRKKKKGVVAGNISSVTFTPTQQKKGGKNYLKCMTCALRGQVGERVHVVERTIRLRNRVVG